MYGKQSTMLGLLAALKLGLWWWALYTCHHHRWRTGQQQCPDTPVVSNLNSHRQDLDPQIAACSRMEPSTTGKCWTRAFNLRLDLTSTMQKRLQMMWCHLYIYNVWNHIKEKSFMGRSAQWFSTLATHLKSLKSPHTLSHTTQIHVALLVAPGIRI